MRYFSAAAPSSTNPERVMKNAKIMSAARSQRISTLYIARVQGYVYPTLAENENGILEEYFSISREVKHGECIIIQKEEDNR